MDLNDFLERVSDIVSNLSKLVIGASLIAFAVLILVSDVYLGFLFYSTALTPVIALGLEAAPQLFADFINFLVVTEWSFEEMELSNTQLALLVVTAMVWLADAFKDGYQAYLMTRGEDVLLVFMGTAMAFILSAFGEAALLFLPSMIKKIVR